MEYLDFRCQDEQRKHPEYQCGKHIGGPSIHSIMRHDFSDGPFVDMRHCPKCGWIEITIEDIGKPVKMRHLGKETKVDFQKPEKLFGFVVSVKEPDQQ